MKNILAFLAGGFGVILMLGIGLAQMIIGYIGIEYHLGSGWAIGAVILALMFRFSFPLTVGTFFGAIDVWFFFADSFINYITRFIINDTWRHSCWYCWSSFFI